jgi:hypothetical protein
MPRELTIADRNMQMDRGNAIGDKKAMEFFYKGN